MNDTTEEIINDASAESQGKDNVVNLPTPYQLKCELDKAIVGQDEAKIVLSVSIYNHFKRVISAENGTQPYRKNNVLMIGPSGCGKTEIVKTIAKIIGIPVYIADATSLTQSGYVGDDVETVLRGLLNVCGMDPEVAKYGIVCIDEIDKSQRRVLVHP